MEQAEKRLTLKEASNNAPEPVSPTTLRRAILAGVLPAVYVVGRWRIRESDLLRFLKIDESPSDEVGPQAQALVGALRREPTP
jgi:predicted site-specific integrase-resolvase